MADSKYAMMQSLTYRPPQRSAPRGAFETTKSGGPIYYGDPFGLENWIYAVRNLQRGTKPENKNEATCKILEGLKGSAHIEAKTIGLDRLYKEDGIDLLVTG